MHGGTFQSNDHPSQKLSSVFILFPYLGGRGGCPWKATRRPARRLRGREIEQSGNFLGLELLQDITPEIAHTTEKPIFGLGQSSAPG